MSINKQTEDVRDDATPRPASVGSAALAAPRVVRDEQSAAEALVQFQCCSMSSVLDGPFREWDEERRDAYRREILARFRFWDSLPLTDRTRRDVADWRRITLRGLNGAPPPTLAVVS